MLAGASAIGQHMPTSVQSRSRCRSAIIVLIPYHSGPHAWRAARAHERPVTGEQRSGGIVRCDLGLAGVPAG